MRQENHVPTGLTYDYEGALRVNGKNRDYLAGKVDRYGHGIKEMTKKVLSHLKDADLGLVGGYNTGFPFHSLSADGTVIRHHPEYAHYTGELAKQIKRAMAGSVLWPCMPCQQRPEYTPADCADCQLSEVKPRTVMKAMPDVDIFVVLERVDQGVLDRVWNVAQEKGCTQSDFDLNYSLLRIEEVMDSWREGRSPQHFLPIDLHVISQDDFLQACEQLRQGENVATPQIWSMYAEWKQNKGIDWWFDFVFSMTPEETHMDNALAVAVREARHGLTEHYSVDQLVDMVRQRSHRARQLLLHPESEATLRERVARWRLT